MASHRCLRYPQRAWKRSSYPPTRIAPEAAGPSALIIDKLYSLLPRCCRHNVRIGAPLCCCEGPVAAKTRVALLVSSISSEHRQLLGPCQVVFTGCQKVLSNGSPPTPHRRQQQKSTTQGDSNGRLGGPTGREAV